MRKEEDEAFWGWGGEREEAARRVLFVEDMGSSVRLEGSEGVEEGSLEDDVA